MQYRLQVKYLERSLSDSHQRLQQLQLHVQQSEEQAAASQLQLSEHVQRLQALHAEAMKMRQQEVGVLVLVCTCCNLCVWRHVMRADGCAAARQRAVDACSWAMRGSREGCG